MHHHGSHHSMEHAYHGTSFYDPRFQDEHFVGWVGFSVLAPALLLAGAALLWRAFDGRRVGEPPLRWGIIGFAGLSAVATGVAFIAEAARNRQLYQHHIRGE
ncbi:MAG: hypothetical protein WBH90_11180 [Aggregatilineales bacterium]|nr:hypothetical protein [Chloroflexota bacterium]HOA25096.1 hypothetical protein [Aggregatilineales bacterium]HQE19071.1 hypothetical protein [Aggregatilineales bacterium]